MPPNNVNVYEDLLPININVIIFDEKGCARQFFVITCNNYKRIDNLLY